MAIIGAVEHGFYYDSEIFGQEILNLRDLNSTVALFHRNLRGETFLIFRGLKHHTMLSL